MESKAAQLDGRYRWLGALALGVQGVGVGLWWWLLWSVPEVRGWFRSGELADEALLFFWLPDAIGVVVGSLAAAMLLVRNSKQVGAVLWVVTGAVGYGTLYTVAQSLWTGQAWLSVLCMGPMLGLTWCIAWAYGGPGDLLARCFRTSTGGAMRWVRTVVQISVFWGLFLWVCPYVLWQVEQTIGLVMPWYPLQGLVGKALFVVASGLGLWSGFVMCSVGGGTPLPLDGPQQLVTCGPYGWVRNPMVVAGIAQGLGVALWLGSVTVGLYAVAGAVAWTVLVRPLEEAHLAVQFGDSYAVYRARVRLWIPLRRRG